MQPSSRNKQLNVLKPPLYREQRMLCIPLPPKQRLQSRSHRMDCHSSLSGTFWTWTLPLWGLLAPPQFDPFFMARNALQGNLDGIWLLCGFPTTCLQAEVFWTASPRFLLMAEERWMLSGSLWICQLYLAYNSPAFFLYIGQSWASSFSSFLN